ncbi:MAG: saccharopine dehydrogenase family protein [Hyphomicrobiales bacterium]
MRFLVLGAGLQGYAAAFDLARTPGVREVVVADVDPERAARAAERLGGLGAAMRADALDVANEPRLVERLQGYDVVISAVPYFLNLILTRAAIAARVSFCDLGGNTDLVREQETLDGLAKESGVTIVPDCGLAPGMANVLASAGIARLDRADAVKIRVGGLPLRPKPPLEYMMVFSMHGLLNEYLGRATALRDGKRVEIETLTEVETLDFPKPAGTCEAFVTLGGTSTMPWTYEGKLKTLDYKTVRYPGHAAKLRLLRDLGLLEKEPIPVDGVTVSPRSVFAAAAEPRLTFPNEPDLVVMRVTVAGTKDGARREIVFDMVDRMDERHGITAMMRTTAYPTTAAALMIARGEVPLRGVAAMERALPAEAFFAELPRHELRITVRERAVGAAPARAKAKAKPGAGNKGAPAKKKAATAKRKAAPKRAARATASRKKARPASRRARGSGAAARGRKKARRTRR